MTTKDPNKALAEENAPPAQVNQPSLAVWSQTRPILAIITASLIAVLINCSPVIFSGKSFVSPTSVGACLYGWWPPLPGMEQTQVMNGHGSDTGATLWQMVPWALIQSESIFKYGEFPFWNRYSHAGSTLMGQGTSQLGDPLHLIVLLGRGSPLAWDIKYLLAKVLFCIGVGLLILRLFGSGSLAMLYAALAAYCGAFFYINNHPAFFVLCYTPWILVSAIKMLDLNTRHFVRWVLVWLVASVSCFYAGFIALAVILIGTLNAAALTHALILSRQAADLRRVITRMSLMTLLFVGLTAPCWLPFLAAEQGAYSAHTEIKVDQFSLSRLAGIFDDRFHEVVRQKVGGLAEAPGSNFIVLVGFILSVLHWKTWRKNPFFWVNSGAILLWGGWVFGWFPANIIALIPYLNRVGHLDSDFSYVLILHLTVQSAFGFKAFAESHNFAKSLRDVGIVAAVIFAMILSYPLLNAGVKMPWGYFFAVGLAAVLSPLLFIFVMRAKPKMKKIGLVILAILVFIPHFRFAFYDSGNPSIMMIPGPRTDFDPPSPAVDRIKRKTTEPFRVVGLQSSLIGNYSAAYRLEDIRSCSPLSNADYINFFRSFPGISFREGGWEIEVKDPIAARPLLNFLNIHYMLAHPRTRLPDDFPFPIDSKSDFLVLKNPQAWPRAFFSSTIHSTESHKDFVQSLLKSPDKPFVALTSEEISKHSGLEKLVSESAAKITPATNYSLTPNTTSFDIRISEPGVVCLTEGQAKTFTATANGQPIPVLTVNRAFKGVYLETPGDYRLKFVYRPKYWGLACVLFWISLAGCTVLALLHKSSCSPKASIT